MLGLLLITLFATIAVAALVSLTDSALKWRDTWRALQAEMVCD